MKTTKDESLVVESSACWRRSSVSRRLAGGQHQRADRAHRAALGRRGDAEEDRAEHQEDQDERRDQPMITCWASRDIRLSFRPRSSSAAT